MVEHHLGAVDGERRDHGAPVPFERRSNGGPEILFVIRLVVLLVAVGRFDDDDVGVVPETIKAATLLFVTIPIILVYPWLQKYFVKGIMLG